MYKYETHLHTAPVSECAIASVEETLHFYKARGYDGVFITNHFINGNIGMECREKPYAERIEYYFSAYDEGKKIGEEIGIKVFCGIESSYKGTDFLVYGLSKEWFLAHPEIEGMKPTELLALYMENGAFIVQAHPYREAGYIDHIRLFPRSVHGVEIVNGGQSSEYNELAEIYAEHYGLLKFAGSDNHHAGKHGLLAGMQSETPVLSTEDFINKMKNGEMTVFVDEHSDRE